MMNAEQGVCAWAMNHPLEREYHDKEWGRAVHDDTKLFEFLTLEGAQAGLSWLTVLKKREGYRQAFLGYDLQRLAQCDESHVEQIIAEYDVVKHRGKIASVFSNARAALALQQEFGSLDAALWQFVGGQPKINHWVSMSDVPASTEESKAMSKFLKKRGFKFVGETICYAFMQACGLVNDHLVGCPNHSNADKL
ncbi:DNA-3-methyladenine glycosylase I [Vibrio cholerae]|uniref:DNA-3-methyladenine glycosylase I n=1 Tax=Vibrio cholerae TaxID=666 RepID=UPI0002046AF9|nr:DNA-3-methyladenine glycosylase I [Vibrio cholerae]AEA78689.1 DNA-3-methyladenine glycosylase [Vibrio cholerae LMA3984-4]EGQ7673208.1 DNA-3-methyladenine glycosylase I [Vibrio cholerae]EGQ8189561.1 DNA-3-methyladenine glycosylase I [Vibrio cholerae]EGR0356650.1 DNA-3-methyladenine glycosylase I [Vibrio cholerae]EGR4049309.1 DNA-3-methyladenine glycosylase I [Vibrio cholerae]